MDFISILSNFLAPIKSLIYFFTMLQFLFLSYAYSIVGEDSYIMKVLSKLFLWLGVFFAYTLFLPLAQLVDKEAHLILLVFSPLVSFPVLKHLDEFRRESFRVKRLDTIAKTPKGKEIGKENNLMIILNRIISKFRTSNKNDLK